MAYTIQQGSANLTTYWRAYDVTTGADYGGAEIAHNATGLTLMYARDRALAVTAVTAGSPAPADLADAAADHIDWGWCRVAGPFYRADFPDAVALTDLRKTLLAVYGISNVTFVQVTLADVVAGDPTAAPLTDSQIATAVVSNAAITTIDANIDTLVARVPSTVPTAVQTADALLGRSIAGGADGGRTVESALASLRNRVVISGGTLTVYDVDDTTPLWTGAITGTPAVTESNPA